MSTDTSAQVAEYDGTEPAGTSSDRLRNWILAGATVLGPLLMLIGLALEVDDGEDSDKGAVLLAKIAEAGPDRFYLSNLLAALGLTLLAAGGLTVMRLVRGRGGALATAGGVLAMIAGPAAGAGIFMYGAVAKVMTEDGLDRGAMGALQDRLSDAAAIAPPFAIGFLGSAVALLLIAGALLRSKVVPVWVPIAIVVSGFAFALVDSGGAAQGLTLVPLAVAYAVLAARLAARTR